MGHGALHLVNVEGGIPVRDQFDVLVLGSKPLDAKILESAIGDGFTHLLELRVGETPRRSRPDRGLSSCWC